MRLAEEEIQLFNDSLDRCVANPSFLDDFYDRFIGGSEAVAAKFADTDMRRQKRALKASLYTAMLAADGNEPALRHLRWLCDRHRELGIAAGDYGYWLDCLLATIRESGGEIDVRTERVWRKVLEIAIRIMSADPTPD